MTKLNRYEVHEHCICGGWVNNWRICVEGGDDDIETFKHIADAQIEIDEIVDEMGYDPEDYRIFDRVNQEYVG